MTVETMIVMADGMTCRFFTCNRSRAYIRYSSCEDTSSIIWTLSVTVRASKHEAPSPGKFPKACVRNVWECIRLLLYVLLSIDVQIDYSLSVVMQ